MTEQPKLTKNENVIFFPEDRIEYPNRVGHSPRSLEEIYLNLDAMASVHVNETVEKIFKAILPQLDKVGIDLTADGLEKDGSLLIEAFRSLLYKINGVNHQFQTLAEVIFQNHPDNDGTYKIVDKLDIELDKNGT